MTTTAGTEFTHETRSAGTAPNRPPNGDRRRAGPSKGEKLARGLGWFSIGLGLAELAAPEVVGRLIGAPGSKNVNRIRAFGMREIANGIGILSQPRSAGWVWTRVGGDVMDLAMLGSAYGSRRANHNRLSAAALAVAGVTFLDVVAGRRLSEEPVRDVSDRQKSRVHVIEVVTIDTPPEAVYEFWRTFENLPRFMEHLESVQTIDGKRSRWKATVPAGATVEWEAEIVDDRPGEMISWRSLPASDVPNSGSVRFTPAPAGQGTEVRVELDYDPPGGALATAVAKLFGEEPGQQVGSDLRRLKQLLETGEVVHSDASIHRGMHPARPSVDGRGESR